MIFFEQSGRIYEMLELYIDRADQKLTKPFASNDGTITRPFNGPLMAYPMR